jgi:hypothetical protein
MNYKKILSGNVVLTGSKKFNSITAKDIDLLIYIPKDKNIENELINLLRENNNDEFEFSEIKQELTKANPTAINNLYSSKLQNDLNYKYRNIDLIIFHNKELFDKNVQITNAIASIPDINKFKKQVIHALYEKLVLMDNIPNTEVLTDLIKAIHKEMIGSLINIKQAIKHYDYVKEVTNFINNLMQNSDRRKVDDLSFVYTKKSNDFKIKSRNSASSVTVFINHNSLDILKCSNRNKEIFYDKIKKDQLIQKMLVTAMELLDN